MGALSRLWGRLRRRHRRVALLLPALVLLSACAGTLAVGIEQTPTPDPAPAATLTAMQGEIDRLAAELATAVAPPTSVPTTLGRVAYIKGGDLWFVVAPTGPHQRLTIDGYNREPRWSPSGEWLAYRKDRTVLLEREAPCRDPLRQGQPPCKETVSTFQEQVWTMRRTGEDSRVINLGLTVRGFAWSPRLDRLAYVSDQGHLQVLDPVSQVDDRLVSATSDARVGEIAWSGDGTRIAYEWLADEDEAAGARPNSGIFVIDAAGGPPTLVARGARSSPTLAGWAGDDALLWQRDETAATLVAVTARPHDDASPPTPRPISAEPMLPLRDFVAIGPASQDYPLAFVAGATQATWTNKRIIAGAFSTSTSLAAIAPAWSPDGTRLAYSAMPDAPDLALGAGASQTLQARRLWVANPTTGALQQLTADERYRDERPQWSLRGTHILFARSTTEGQASVWMIPAAGGEPQLVVDELTPAPDLVGNYGYIDWGQHFDWWRG